MTKLYRVHVKPRSMMYHPRQCATSPIPAGVKMFSHKTSLRDERGRRVAEIQHDFKEDKNAWPGTIEDVRWTGASVFRLSAVVAPREVRTGKGRAIGTGYSKLDVLPNQPRDVTWRHQPRWSWAVTEPKQASWCGDEPQTQSWDTTKTGPLKRSPKTRTAKACSDSSDHRASLRSDSDLKGSA